MTTNKNIKKSSFKSSENIQKKAGGPDRSVPDNQSSSVTLDELAMKVRKIEENSLQSVYKKCKNLYTTIKSKVTKLYNASKINNVKSY